jgi:uncharacterized protein YgbK (DUF1537 family)
MTPVCCAVADDDTGATDLAGMLAEQGLRTVLLIDVPDEERVREWSDDKDAVIVGTGTRALPASESYERTREAVRRMRALSPRVLQIKYCSTFDSTTEGNIGPSIDAAIDESGEAFTVALPALPVNGRTTYMGYHFVHQQLLSDSPMRHHPLTPMTNSNLVTHLQAQTKRKVGLATYPVTREKLDRLRDGGVQIAILDCISDTDLQSVCGAIVDLPLISGSSAPGVGLPSLWREKGWWTARPQLLRRLDPSGTGYLVVAGSCSQATHAQNEWAQVHGAEILKLDPLQLASGDAPADAVNAVVENLSRGRVCILVASSGRDEVRQVQAWGRAGGWTANETGLRIAYTFAEVARQVLEARIPAGLIVAGGETSGAVCRRLELHALEIGRNIEPGVPLCVSLGRFRLPVALKSGNFGSADFYARAVVAMQAL